MTELRRKVSGIKVVLLVIVLAVLLTACSGPASPEVNLKADNVALPDGGGKVVLRLEVTRGTVTSVVFKKQDGSESVTVNTPKSPGIFENERTVTTTTTFLAEATGPNGKTSKTLNVTVAPRNPANDPKAPSTTAALKGFEGLDLVVGTPTGLAVVATTIPGVTGGIAGDVKAETKATPKGNVTIQAGTNKLEFLYKPKAGAMGADSFEYTVIKSGREARGKIDLSLAAISSANFQLADNLTEINDTDKSIVLLVKDVICNKPVSVNTTPCVSLDNNQSLIGLGSVTVDGITITNASSSKPKIIASMSGTRKSGTASCGTVQALIDANGGVFPDKEFDPRPNCTETKVVILRDNTTVEGIEITSNSTDESSTYFVALYARGDRPVDSSDNVLDGSIKIKNVTINRSNGKPIYIQYTFAAPNVSTPEYGNYNLEIDGLDLNDANDTLVVGNPRNLIFKNSTIELLQPEGNNAGPQPFGDNSGVQIANYVNGNITLDNVDVYMESTRYRIDFMPEGMNAIPIEIFNSSAFTASVSSNLIVKNCDVTYGAGGILSSEVASFKVGSDGGVITINSTESLNNKSVKGLVKNQTNGGSVTGQIQVSP